MRLGELPEIIILPEALAEGGRARGKYCWKLQGESGPRVPSRVTAVPRLPSSKTYMGPSTTSL